MKFNEEKFKEIVKPYLMECREGDWNHSRKVVFWIKKIGKNKKDLPLLIVAGYLHDSGWYKVLPKTKTTLAQIRKYERIANPNSSVMVNKILKPLGYSKKEINEVNRLIAAADRHRSKRDNEAIIVDADSLSKLSITHLGEKYKKTDWHNLISLWRKELPKRIKTEAGKKIYPKLLTELINRIKK